MRVAAFDLPGRGRTWAKLETEVARPFDRAPWLGGQLDGTTLPLPATWACPVTPSKIICVGRNYREHAKELGNEPPKEPLLFLKPPSSLLASGGTVLLPEESSRVEHEAELGLVIGRRTKNVTRAEAVESVFGYVPVADVTARDLQIKDGQWTRAKGFDTFCPVGPWIDTELNPQKLRLRCRVNGSVRQDASTADMLFDVPTLVAYASRVMTLEPGDLLSTGTPEGVSTLAPGDRFEVDIEGLGVLEVNVAKAP